MTRPLFLAPYPSFGDFDREALRRLARQVNRPGVRMAEVGSWLGTGSTQVLIDELERTAGTLVCVDTWEGSPNVPRHLEIVRDYDVFGTFLHNVERAGERVRPVRLTSLEAAAAFPDATFDLVFLDGDHSYDATLQDIGAWRRKVAPGGMLCGHDCEARLTDANRALMAGNRHLDTVPGTGTVFSVNHPGVILAVAEAFGAAAHLWAEESLELADRRRGRATIWDVRVR